MTERPIIFSVPMVRALLDGSKTQTRRVVTNPHRSDEGNFVLQDYGSGMWPYRSHDGESGCYIDRQKDGDYFSEAPLRCPYGRRSDRLWVREAFAVENTRDYEGDPGIVPPLGPVQWKDEAGEANYRLIPRYRASEPDTQLMIAPSEKDDIGMRWKPSIHMPRWASRILLEITDVRVERLQDISEADARAEGCDPWTDLAGVAGVKVGERLDGYRRAYALLWDRINGAGAWDANPWVWAVSFKRVPSLAPGEQGRQTP